MMDLAHLFRDVWAWSLDQAEPWHNWAAHGLIAASLGLLIGVIAKAFGAPFGVGPWTAASYYVLRESEELMLAWGFPASIDWKDHALDAGVPVICSVIVYLVSRLRYGPGYLQSRLFRWYTRKSEGGRWGAWRVTGPAWGRGKKIERFEGDTRFRPEPPSFLAHAEPHPTWGDG